LYQKLHRFFHWKCWLYWALGCPILPASAHMMSRLALFTTFLEAHGKRTWEKLKKWLRKADFSFIKAVTFLCFRNLMKAEARTMCCFHWAKKFSWEKDRKNSAANSEWKKHLHQALKPHGREVLFPVPHTLFQITCFYTIVLSRY
jgi:hypothetical protein